MRPLHQQFMDAENRGHDLAIEAINSVNKNAAPAVAAECAHDPACDCHESAAETADNDGDKATFEKYP